MDIMQYGLDPLAHSSGLSRRGFVMTALATGFAIAANPLLAQAIKTDTDGLIAGEVQVPALDGMMPAYRAMPAAPGRYPVILVVQEIFGVHEHIKDMCRRFAKLGYYAIAPELYARQGDVSKMTSIDDILSQVVAKVPDAQVMSDLDATLRFAGNSGTGNASNVATVGFCWGGRIVWLYAEHNPSIKAGVAYYGPLEGPTSELKQKNPIDIVGDLQVPVLGLYAGGDAMIKPEMVERMRAGIAKNSSGSQIVVFPGVSHGFNADYRPSYDKAAADKAWKLTRDWLRKHGV